MLRNQFYLGKIPWKGRVWAGQHSALIDPAIFKAAQAKLDGKQAVQKRKHDHLFRGLVRCGECKSSISWRPHKGRLYGRCESKIQCSRRSYEREDRVEEHLIRRLEGARHPFPDVAAWVAADLRANLTQEDAPVEAARQGLQRRYDDLERRLGLAYEDRLDGRITVNRYDSLCATYKDEQAEIQEKLRGQP